MRLPGSLRSIQALGRHLALPLAFVYVALITLLAFGHRCPNPYAVVGELAPNATATGLNAHSDLPAFSGQNPFGLKHTDSGSEHRCALCALHHQESAPPARPPLVRQTASPPLPYLTVSPSPLTGAPLAATSRGPPHV